MTEPQTAVLEAQALPTGPAFTIQTQPISLPTVAPAASSALATVVADPAKSDAMVYFTHLSQPDKVRAMNDAKALFAAVAPDMLKVTDIAQLISVDRQALDPLNGVVKRALTEVEPVSLPMLKDAMRTFQRQMAAARGNYDISNPKVKSDYDKWLNGSRGFLFKVKDFLAALKADIQKIETQIDNIERMLEKGRVETMKNVVIYDQLFTTNEQGIQNLMYAIAVMELFVQYVARQTPPATKPDGAPLTDHEVDIWKQTQSQLIMIVQTKIANAKGRLGIAWATSPQTRMSQMTDIALTAQLENLKDQAIPLARQLLLTMRTAMRSYQNAQLANNVAQLVNTMAQQNAELHQQTVTAVMAAASNPIFWPETIRFISECLDKAADGVVAGYQAGEARHAEINASLTEQSQVLSNATGKISDATRQRVLAVATQGLPPELANVSRPAISGSVG